MRTMKPASGYIACLPTQFERKEASDEAIADKLDRHHL